MGINDNNCQVCGIETSNFETLCPECKRVMYITKNLSMRQNNMDLQATDILEAEKEAGMIQHQAISAINDLYTKGYYLELAEIRDLAARKTGEMNRA